MLTTISTPQHGWTTPTAPQFIKSTAHQHHNKSRATQNYTPHQRQPYHTKRLNIALNPRPAMLPMVRSLPMRPVGIYGKWRITRTLLINLEDRYITFLPHKKRQASTRRIFAIGQDQPTSTPNFTIQNYQSLLTSIMYNPFLDKPYYVNTFMAHFRLS